jgi:hypothetical protein
MIAIIPILMIVVGALVYALSTNGKVAELGRLTFLAGIIALAFAFSERSISVLTH